MPFLIYVVSGFRKVMPGCARTGLNMERQHRVFFKSTLSPTAGSILVVFGSQILLLRIVSSDMFLYQLYSKSAYPIISFLYTMWKSNPINSSSVSSAAYAETNSLAWRRSSSLKLLTADMVFYVANV